MNCLRNNYLTIKYHKNLFFLSHFRFTYIYKTYFLYKTKHLLIGQSYKIYIYIQIKKKKELINLKNVKIKIDNSATLIVVQYFQQLT